MKPPSRWLSPFLLSLLIGLNSHCLSISAASEATPELKNAILKGNLIKGDGGAPQFWNTQAYENEAEITNYKWNHTAGAPASLEILSTEANDARWEQHVRLAPGWYFFTAELRTEDVEPGGTDECLSLIDRKVFVSRELRGTTDWQKVGF